ncbi:MAG: DUF962 domain-containing protein [Dongiaceae bacterium]
MTERDRYEPRPRIGGTPNPGAGPDNYRAFWQRYLLLHRKEGSRRLHYLGSAFAPLLLLWALIHGPIWLLLFVPLAGYLPAWAGHFLIEGNRPATFGHPLWSIWSDYRMLGLWLAFRLDREYARHGIA